MNFKTLALFLFAAALVTASRGASTATLVPDSSYLLPGGGTATITVNVAGFPGATTGIAIEATLPSGWAYVSGVSEPGVKPQAGDTGALGWAYFSIPETSSFTFTALYPANITADRSLVSVVTIAAGGSNETVTPGAVTFSPATAPVITSAGTASAAFGSTLGYNITATSSVVVTAYGATGLPAGLSVNTSTGLISGAPTASGTFNLTLSATNAAGSATKPLTLTVSQASGAITLSGLGHMYDGSAKSATVVTAPAGLGVTVAYAGSAAAPVNAGSYAVAVSIADPNYTATASGTLVIEPAAQVVDFVAAGAVQPGQSITLSATASSGLGVSFSLVSGSATLTGSTLAITGAGSVVVRATQAGNANYLGAFSDQTLNSSRLSQTITFNQPPDRLATDGSFTLTASASSGLAVTFTVISGPALLNGGSVTLTGAPGTVMIRAAEAGDENHQPAPEVTRSFDVVAEDDRVFFGSFFSTSLATTAPVSSTGMSVRRAFSSEPLTVAKVGEVAAVLPAQSNEGSLLIVAPEVGISGLVSFSLREDGSFTTMLTQQAGPNVPATRTLAVHGQLAGNLLSGRIDEVGFSFATEVELSGGPSAEAAGFYLSTALETAQGTTYTIIGSNNNVLVLSVTPTLMVGGPATLQPDGTFQLEVTGTTLGTVTLQGSIDVSTTTVAGTVVIPNQPPIDFAGLETGTARTDRLIGLSSRGRVGSGEKLLIAGVVIGGTQPKDVLIRAIGPSLSSLGVQGALADPRIRLFRGATQIAENDDWGSNANVDAIAAAAGRIGAFAVTRGSKDAILVATLQPGAYTVHVTGGEGVALADIYDASENPQSEYQRLVAISTRGEVGTGENVLIGGLVINGNSPKKVLIRGVGPGLTAQGVAGPLADPTLKVFHQSTQIAQNDNWSADAVAAAEITAAESVTGAFPLTSGSKDAAVLLTLAPGLYTVHVAGAGNTAGVALVEIYEFAE